MGVTGTCAQRSRWSRLRTFVARASFVGGLAAGACLGAVATASAAPGDEAASEHRVEITVPDIASQVGNEVAADRLSSASVPPHTESASPADSIDVGEPADPVAPVEPATPAKPAKPQVERPDPVEVDPPAVPSFPGSPFEEEPEEPAEPAAISAPPPPAPAAVPAPESSEPTRYATTEPTSSASTSQQRAEPPPAPAPNEPAAERNPGPPAPVQTPPAPTMATAGSAPGGGSGPRYPAILPAAAHEPRAVARTAEHPETVPLSGIVSFEPSTSPD